jgi:hypothetical protein
VPQKIGTDELARSADGFGLRIILNPCVRLNAPLIPLLVLFPVSGGKLPGASEVKDNLAGMRQLRLKT